MTIIHLSLCKIFNCMSGTNLYIPVDQEHEYVKNLRHSKYLLCAIFACSVVMAITLIVATIILAGYGSDLVTGLSQFENDVEKKIDKFYELAANASIFFEKESGRYYILFEKDLGNMTQSLESIETTISHFSPYN
jgi:hypothetical protein